MASNMDIFGDSSLFDEFERERQHNIFIPSDSVSVDTFSDIKQQDDGSDATDEDSDMVEEQNNSAGELEMETAHGVHTREEKVDAVECDAKPLSKKELHKIQSDGRNRSIDETLNENKLLRRYTRLVDTTRLHPVTDDSQCVQVLYQNNTFARKHRIEIEEFLAYLIEKDQQSQNHERIPELELQAGGLTSADLSTSRSGPSDVRLRRTHAFLGCSHMYRDFIIDGVGWPLIDNNPALTHGCPSTQYEQVFRNSLPCDEAEELKSSAQSTRNKTSCFNCGEAHMLSQCTKPHDQKRIRASSRQFREKCNAPKFGLSSNSNQSDKRFQRFKPGVFSDELRSALGLGDDQLPPFIYSMRLLGYPPGWSMEAKKLTSGLMMFDKHGKEVAIEEDTVDNPQPNLPQQQIFNDMDVHKLVSYPGFTVEAPNFKEESHLYHMPPLQPHQLNATIMDHFNKQEQERKRRSEIQKDKENKRRKLETESDMDLDTEGYVSSAPDFASPRYSPGCPPLPDDNSPCLPPLPDSTPPTSSRTSTPSSAPFVDGEPYDVSDSMSLEDLENKYKQLRDAIADDHDQPSPVRDLRRCLTKDLTDAIPSPRSSDERVVGTSKLDSKHTESPLSVTRSIERSAGTPVLTSVKSALPHREQFGCGIGDHIPFENLPDATGRFDKLRQMLSKIRESAKSAFKK